MQYLGIDFSDHRPASLAAVQACEESFGTKFPSQYVTFLRNVNGGRPKPRVFSYKGEDSGKLYSERVYVFFAIEQTQFSLEYAFETFVDSKRLPKGYLPIASTRADEIVCIDTKDGRVYIWV